jgi:hypothetical protein
MYVFDIFSKPFMFKVSRGEEKKKTNFGGAVTLFVIILSFSYFISILVTFFTRATPPTITSQIIINTVPTRPDFIIRHEGEEDRFYSPV